MEAVGCAVSFSCSEPESSQSSPAMPRMLLRARRFSPNARRVTKSGRTQRTQSARCSTGCSGERPGLSPEQPVEHRADCVLCVLPDLVTRLALGENLLARSSILGIAGDDCEDSGSEHENETAHPTASMADKEYARASRSSCLTKRLHRAGARN